MCLNVCGPGSGPVVTVASLAMIVVCSIGLGGALSLHSVSAGVLTTSLFSGNLPAFIVSIIGLCGATTTHVVSGVGLSFGIISFMLGICKTGAYTRQRTLATDN